MDYPTKERNEKIIEMREEGMSYEKIAGHFGITRERVRQIVIRMQFCNKHAYQKYYDAMIQACHNLGYPETTATRTYNGLLRSHIFLEMNEANLNLNDYSDAELMRIRNFGVKSLKVAREADSIVTGKPYDDSKVFKFQDYYEAFMKASKQLGYSSNSANRAYSALLTAGIFKNINDNNKTFDNFTDEYLMRIIGFGEKSLNVVRMASKILKNN